MLFLFLLLLLTLLFLVSQATVNITWRKRNRDDYVCYEFHACFGLITVRKELIGIAQRETKQTVTADELMQLISHSTHCFSRTAGIREWMDKVAKRTVCRRLMWHSHIGLGDALATALISGLYWTLKSMVQIVVQTRIKCSTPPDTMIVPQFNQFTYETYLQCTVNIRMYQLICTCLELVLLIVRKPSAIPHWLELLQAIHKLMKKPSVRSN